MKSRNWTAIERLPETPGVVKYTTTGYWLDGRFYPSAQPRSPMPQQRRGIISRVLGGWNG